MSIYTPCFVPPKPTRRSIAFFFSSRFKTLFSISLGDSTCRSSQTTSVHEGSCLFKVASAAAMGKRRVVVISSSEEEEFEESRRKNETTTTRTGGCSSSGRRSKCSRKRIVSTSSSADWSSCKEGMVDFESLSEDFSECLNGLHTISGLRKMSAKELWVDKHKPHCFDDLAVHKKKVGEIRKWFEDRMSVSKEECNSNVLLVTGQAGSGKSVAIHVIASQLGIELYEWMTPTPTLWQEHIHNSQSGLRYMSKLDEFENFVEHIRKYTLLSSKSRSGLKKPVFLLIDDIPVTNGRVSYERLSRCLYLLVRSARVPTIILLTQYPRDEYGDRTCHWEDLEASVGRAGAYKVSFNPLTTSSIKKTLLRICRVEKCDVSEEWINLIARSSGGDIRHAISVLQYVCIEPQRSFDLPPTNISGISSMANQDRKSLMSVSLVGESDNTLPFLFGKEESISLFHALGKFLHNKREMEDSSESSSFALHERFKRLPLKMDSPEIILSQAHGLARKIADFLHENVLDFLGNEAIGDAWTVASYLSDADYLLATGPYSSRPQNIMMDYEPGLISQSSAASVAVRGVLFGNSQPLTSRWHTIRKPYLWQVEQSRHLNENTMMQEFGFNTNFSSNSISDMATDFVPVAKWLRSRAPVDANYLGIAQCAFNMEKESALDTDSLTTVRFSRDIEEDEIEDW